METSYKKELPAELPEPWYWTTQELSDQLQKEISPRHPLYQTDVITVARRQDNDDVLFQLSDNECPYVVVHLTWSTNGYADGRYPKTRPYKDWEDVYTNCILKDVAEFQ